MADSKTMWRGQSATLTIGTIQDLSQGHISKYVFNVMNGNTSANGSFTGSGEGESNNRAITTSAHVASGNTNGYTNYTVNGYLKYKHYSYGVTTYATSNTVTNSLQVKEPLDKESLSGFEINPTEVWSNLGGSEHIRIYPSFNYTTFSKFAQITCSQKPAASGGGSNGVAKLELADSPSCYVEYQNTNTNKDLGAESMHIGFNLYSIAGTSAAESKQLYSKTLTVKNAVTELSISKLLTTYNNASQWDPHEVVRYTPGIPYSKEVSLVHETTDTAYSNNTISYNGITVQLDHSTGAFRFDVSQVDDVTKTSTLKFRVKSIQGARPVYSNVMTFTVLGFTASHTVTIWEGETTTIDNLGIGTIGALPSNLTNVTVKKISGDLGIEIKGKAVSSVQTETFTITSTNGSKVTINCTVKNIQDISRTINTGDTITITGAEIKAATQGISVTSIKAITTGPASGNGTAYVSGGKLIYYAPTTAVEDVPITVTTDTDASAVIHMKVKAITMSIV